MPGGHLPRLKDVHDGLGRPLLQISQHDLPRVRRSSLRRSVPDGHRSPCPQHPGPAKGSPFRESPSQAQSPEAFPPSGGDPAGGVLGPVDPVGGVGSPPKIAVITLSKIRIENRSLKPARNATM